MRKLLVGFFSLFMAGCATGYQPMSITGGFDESQIRDGIWRVVFSGNGYATRETVQTYWLYRCSELALEKGYDGFEIISNVNLASAGESGFVQVQLAEKPAIGGTIRLLKAPIKVAPPKIFDARKLKEKLEPLVKGKSCGSNVCPHFHGYLLPDV